MPEGGIDLQGLPEEAQSVEAPEVENEVGETEQSEPEHETARETVERQLNLLKEGAGSEGAESKASSKVKDGVVKRSAKQKEQQQQFEIPPPNRLNAAQKEVFNKLPPDLRRATHEMFKNHEGLVTRAMQQARNAEREAAHVVETVRPYLLAHPELQEEGYTEAKLVSSLIAAHQRLTDPKTAKQTWIQLGQQIGIPSQALTQFADGQTGTGAVQSDISQHPQFRALQERLNQVTSVIDGRAKQEYETTVSGIVSEMEAVRNEKDNFGRYLYPKLHEDDFLEQAKPLVSALIKVRPGLGYGEALRQAYATLEGQNGNFSQGSQARFPQQQVSPSAAAVSVRGRSAPSAPSEMEEIPPEALKDARATTAWALKQLRRG
jgi:hypothetical protein